MYLRSRQQYIAPREDEDEFVSYQFSHHCSCSMALHLHERNKGLLIQSEDQQGSYLLNNGMSKGMRTHAFQAASPSLRSMTLDEYSYAKTRTTKHTIQRLYRVDFNSTDQIFFRT